MEISFKTNLDPMLNLKKLLCIGMSYVKLLSKAAFAKKNPKLLALGIQI